MISVLEYNHDVVLKKNDSLFVHSIFEFIDKNFCFCRRQCEKAPGTVEWRGNLTLRDLLLSVGGLTESGDSTNIEISRRLNNANSLVKQITMKARFLILIFHLKIMFISGHMIL